MAAEVCPVTRIRHLSRRPSQIVPGQRAPQATRHDTPTAAARDLGTCVYVAQVGDEIRIASSTDIDRAIRQYGLSWHHVLLALPADTLDEQALHDRFAAHHTRGKFYRPDPELLDWINNRRGRLGAQPI